MAIWAGTVWCVNTIVVSGARRVALTFVAGFSVLATLLAAIAVSSAWAISADYCAQNLNNGERCYEGSGFRGWTYHQSSTGSGGVLLPGVCAFAWTGRNYRDGSGCTSGAIRNFYSFESTYFEPLSNSSVSWAAYGNSSYTNARNVIYGHADSR